MSRRCVLVDDDADFAAFLRVWLARVCPALEIITFLDGSDALKFLANTHVDLVITDFRMPLLNGLRLTRLLRRGGSNVPIVVMSGDEIRGEAIAAGANAFMPKKDITRHIGMIIERSGLTADVILHRNGLG